MTVARISRLISQRRRSIQARPARRAAALPLPPRCQALPVNNNSVAGTFGAFMLQLAGMLSMAILAWSLFFPPVALARRQDMILDPQMWPATGVVALTVIIIALFVGAMVVGIL